MSRIRIIGGKLTEIIGGDYIIYSAGDIITNSNSTITETATEGTFYGEPEVYESVDKLKGVKVTAIVFFDGTKNNRNNTFRRLDKDDTKSTTNEDSQKIYAKTKEKQSSYENGYSNIAALSFMAIKDKKNKIAVEYIEGEGTEDDQKGDTMGYAFGSGKTGIPAKVKKGYANITSQINSYFDPGKEYVKELTINVFGFSRGAAAARSFLTTTKADFKTKYPKAIIKYNFVGLFDTVSSYEKEGVVGALGSAVQHDFENDVEELGLRLDGIAKKVIHLTATNEYRKNFALTSIDSAIEAGVGFELELPGAHSDIGGGYEEYEHTELRSLSKSGRDDDLLLAEGWYTENQIKYRGTINCVGTRKLKNSYQFIPLAIMMHFAKQNGMTFKSFDDKEQFKAFKVIPELENIKNKLLNLAIAKEGAVKTIAKLTNEAELKNLRNKYLHISSNEKSLGMGENKPSFWSTKVTRNIIQDNA
jgi:hypothetical protein